MEPHRILITLGDDAEHLWGRVSVLDTAVAKAVAKEGLSTTPQLILLNPDRDAKERQQVVLAPGVTSIMVPEDFGSRVPGGDPGAQYVVRINMLCVGTRNS